jgi:hypothetical protein
MIKFFKSFNFRFLRICIMLTRCMLPISIVEHRGFKEYLTYLDPSFTMPSRARIKDTGLPKLKSFFKKKLKDF